LLFTLDFRARLYLNRAVSPPDHSESSQQSEPVSSRRHGLRKPTEDRGVEKRMERVAARSKVYDEKLQKVQAQVEANNAAPQAIVNN